jgi:talin
MIGEVVEATKPLPGSEEALKLFQETDELEALAESELRACASAIEEAAKTLVDAKRRQLEMRKNKDSPLPEEEIQEAILDAARAITLATATLVQAATVAQKELVDKGKAEKSANQYRRDPAWAKGLISASQAVAGSVKGLVAAANTSVQGKTEEEALIATAKGVAAATARLVFASRTKADPFSPTQKKLSDAAKSVAEATKQLVDAAKSATVQVQEAESRPDWDSLSDTAQKKAELEAQARILKMQNELDKATKHLADIRKREYAEATGKQPPAPVQSPTRAQPVATPPPRPTAAPSQPKPTPAPTTSTPAPAKPTPAIKTSAPGVKKGVARVQPGEKFFTLEQLQSKPAECDPSKLEVPLET